MASSIAPKMARGYATAVQAVKVPVVLYGIDGRYATALYTAAVKKQAVDKVEAELKQVDAIVANDKKILNFLQNPTLNRSAKREGVKEILKNGKFSDLTQNLFQTLADNGRLNVTTKIIQSYFQLMTAHRNETSVTISSAKELDQTTLGKLKDTLNKGSFAKGQKLIFSNKVNPSLLGGLVIEFGDKTIDLSVSSKLAKLNKLVTEPI